MTDKHLIAGPWVGEFGWELYAWQAYVRSLSRLFNKTTVISRPNSRYLYADFANEFVPFTPVGGLADAFFMHDFDLNASLRNIIKEHQIPMGPATTLFVPRRLGNPPYTHYTIPVEVGQFSIVPEYYMYGGKRNISRYDYLFHIRDRKLREEDNWAPEKWIELRALLGEDKKIACIGTPTQSGIVEGADDLRGAPLEETCNLIKGARAVFGPSSGPMHLTSLCGVPHVVWSVKDQIRYTENWNPFSTPILYLNEQGWRAKPQFIYDKYQEWIGS
jgi:hypothetical protein